MLPSYELTQDLLPTNLLTKNGEGWSINVKSRVFNFFSRMLPSDRLFFLLYINMSYIGTHTRFNTDNYSDQVWLRLGIKCGL